MDADNLETTQEVLDLGKKLIEQDMKFEAELQENYPKSFMLKKVQRLLREKEGASDFEARTGVNELLHSPQETLNKLRGKKDITEFRRYHINDD